MIIKDSIELTDDNGLNQRSYQCKNADVSKLPTDVAGGSTCLVLDTGDLYVFSEAETAWIKM